MGKLAEGWYPVSNCKVIAVDEAVDTMLNSATVRQGAYYTLANKNYIVSKDTYWELKYRAHDLVYATHSNLISALHRKNIPQLWVYRSVKSCIKIWEAFQRGIDVYCTLFDWNTWCGWISVWKLTRRRCRDEADAGPCSCSTAACCVFKHWAHLRPQFFLYVPRGSSMTLTHSLI